MARNVSLQRRHFEFLALTLRDLKGKLSDSDHGFVVSHFARALKATNYQFKTDRFIDWALDIPKPPKVRVRKLKSTKAEPILPVEAGDPYWE